jgi:enoyl-CoA hydratase/carnithine racemase
MAERVTIRVEDGIADVRLARPDKMNAFDQQMFESVNSAIDRLSQMREVRCVVLSGEGRAFSVGVDLDALASSPALRDLKPRSHGPANLFQQAAWGWRQLSQPVIAAVHGYAFGAGFQVMLGADVRFVAPDTQLSMMEARWGLCPDVGGIALLRGLVRSDIAREITFTARRFSGVEAVALGIATRAVVDPVATAWDMARVIAANSPDAVRAVKRLYNLAAEATVEAILMAESVEQEILLNSANHRETLLAAREKRAPRLID